MKILVPILLVLSLCMSSCASIQPTLQDPPVQPKSENPTPQKAHREFRAAWVATVANINWPSEPGLSTEAQQQEAIACLDLLDSLNFNAVIFQVRPQADALYDSRLEPWSYFLTGTMGQGPSPYYDPLTFWIKEAHKRGMELHVWLNPYRAHHISGKLNQSSVIYKMRSSVVKLKEGYWWFDPGKQTTQDHGLKVIMDIVKRYDIDGVHFDDYFYPYASYNGNADFPDEATYRAYQQKGGELSKKDWRRDNVNQFVKRVYQAIKAEKPYVKFGISPFGIWRPGHPASIQGMDQYDALYADAKRWLNAGWIDYLSPQLYWTINQIPQSFPVLLKWWSDQNTQHRHLWPGINIGRGEADEVFNQIMISRAIEDQSPGVIHWNIGSLFKHPELADALLQGPYKEKALVPASTWLGDQHLPAPKVEVQIENQQVRISIKPPGKDSPLNWVLAIQYGTTWEYRILNSRELSQTIAKNGGKGSDLNQISITAIDRFGNESAPYLIQIHR